MYKNFLEPVASAPSPRVLKAHLSVPSASEDDAPPASGEAPVLQEKNGASAGKGQGGNSVDHIDWDTFPPRMVRTSNDGRKSIADLVPGDDGFACAIFGEEELVTEVPNLLLERPVRKKPAKGPGRPPKKRPAAADHTEEPIQKKPAVVVEEEDEAGEEEEREYDPEVDDESEEEEDAARELEEEKEEEQEQQDPPQPPLERPAVAAPREGKMVKISVSCSPAGVDNPRIEVCGSTEQVKRVYIFGTTKKKWGERPNFADLPAFCKQLVGCTKHEAVNRISDFKAQTAGQGEDLD